MTMQLKLWNYVVTTLLGTVKTNLVNTLMGDSSWNIMPPGANPILLPVLVGNEYKLKS